MPTFANGRTTVTLNAGQAAGTAPVLAANPNRTTLILGNIQTTNARFDVADTSGGFGMPLPGQSILQLGAGSPNWPACPTDAIYIGGLALNDKITLWEV